VEAPAPAKRRRLDKSELAKGVADCVEGYVSVRTGGTRIGIIAEESPFWQWAIGRFGILTWTWLTNDDGHWTHPLGTDVRRPINNKCSTAEEELCALLESEKVDAVLFDTVAPRARHPLWNSSSIKVVIWIAGKRYHGPPVQHWVTKHADLGGVSNRQFHVKGAKRWEDLPFGKLEMVGIATNLNHVADATIGKGTKVAIPSLDEPTLGTSCGLVDWENRFLPVLDPSVYSKTEWMRRRLVPK
jgi:hypothetical protein